MNTQKQRHEPALHRLVRKLREGDVSLWSGVAGISILLSLGWFFMQPASDSVNHIQWELNSPSTSTNANSDGANSASEAAEAAVPAHAECLRAQRYDRWSMELAGVHYEIEQVQYADWAHQRLLEFCGKKKELLRQLDASTDR